MKIVVLGAGRLAWHLVPALNAAGHEIEAIFNRSLSNALPIAEKVGAKTLNQLADLPQDADLYILAVQDSTIELIAQQLPALLKGRRVVHTSGATPARVLARHCSDYGVFYPLQSFSKEKELDFRKIPLCIDAKYSETKEVLRELARSISDLVYEINDDQRAELHVAAVFVNNFVNHFYGIGQDWLQQHQIPFEILHPLIQNTAEKILSARASDLQTGPAIRRDWETIKRHESQLEQIPEYLELYKMLTQSIIQTTEK